METTMLWRLTMVLYFQLFLAAAPPSSPRYPADLSLDERGKWIFTANEAGSVSALDATSGLVLDELPLSPRGRPHALSVKTRSDGTVLIALSETFIHRVAILAAREEPGAHPLRLEPLAEIEVGRLPAGLLFTEKPERLLVASEGEGEVWEIDARELHVTRRIPAAEGARRIAMGPPGRAIVSGRTAVAEIDLSSGRVLASREVAGGKARNIDGLLVDGAQVFLAHQFQPTEVAIDPQMIAWGLTLSNRVTVLSLEGFSSRVEKVIPLDLRYRAAGDPSGVAIEPGSQAVLVTSAGTNRLLFAAPPEGPTSLTQPLAADAPVPDLYVGRRPVAVRVAPGGKKAYVACYLDDAVVEVDVEQRKVLRTFRLGTLPEATPERSCGTEFITAVVSGATLLLTGGNTVAVSSPFLQGLALDGVGPVRWFWLVAIVAALLTAFLLFKTKTGTHLLATGGNLDAARGTGIHVARTRLLAYLLSGLACGVAGILLVARTGGADPSLQTELLLSSIAAVVLGGSSLFGGRASVLGSAVGAVLLTSLINGFTLIGISQNYQPVAVGAVVLGAAFISRFQK